MTETAELAGAKVARPRRGTNLPRMGDFNQSLILDEIRRSPAGLSRVELARTTRLSAQTISNICRRLLDFGLIVEGGKEGVGPGKPRTILRLNPEGRYAVGVHLDPTVMTFVMLDLTGRVVARASEQTPRASDPDHVVSTIVNATTRLIADSGVPHDRIAGIGIAAPGPIDSERGAIIDPPNLAGWHRVNLRDSLADATGLPAVLDKDVTAAAVAEMWASGDRGLESFIFVYLGTGIGVGIVLNGDVVRGTSGNAGEIGHIVVDPDGPLCTCGQKGCVAVTCAPRDLVEEAVALGVLRDQGDGTTAIDEGFTLLCNKAAAGDGAAREILQRAAARITRAIAVVANILDVDRVVFGGPTWSRLSSFYLQGIPPLLDDLRATRSIHHIGIMGNSVGDDVGAVGGACLILDHTLTPRPGTLLFND
ncbi:ROK family transcriptional regulator [soil metagenome]